MKVSVGYLLYVIAIAITAIVIAAKYFAYQVPTVGPMIMRDSTASLLLALGLALLSRWL